MTEPTTPTRVLVLGLGYVGLELALCAVDAFDVTGFDTDSRRVADLIGCQSYVDDIDEEALAAAWASERFEVHDDEEHLVEAGNVAPFDYAIICVPTGLKNGAPDLLHLFDAARIVARVATPGLTVIIESTIYPGCTRTVAQVIQDASGLKPVDYWMGYSPERRNPGRQSRAGYLATPRLVAGLDDQATARIRDFYQRVGFRHLVGAEMVEDAELAKLIENTYRLVNVALVQQLAEYANTAGLDIWEAIDLAGTKPYGFEPFRPGPGAGGHCIPVDPIYLVAHARAHEAPALGLVQYAAQVNSQAHLYVEARLRRLLRKEDLRPRDATVLVHGLAYKANSSDTRNSAAVDVAMRLQEAGCRVIAYDPLVPLDALPGIERTTDPSEVDAEAVLVLVAHDDVDLVNLANSWRVALDCTGNVPDGYDIERL